MEDLAKALLDLDWSDMDAFAEMARSAAKDDFGGTNDVRYVAQCLVEWATEIVASEAQ